MSFTDLPSILNITFISPVEKAYADPGDFSIFRNNASSTALTTTSLNIGWDTTVAQTVDIPLLADNSSIDLAQAGKYLVMYNVWATENGGTNRRSVETFLTLDGLRIPYGKGAGYLRDSGGDLDMYNAGAAIIEATAGQDLNIVATRDDSNATAGVALRTSTNGVSVLRMNDNFDYLRINKTINTVGIDANTTFTDVLWDANDEVDVGSFGFSNGSGDITLKGVDGDSYLITTNVSLRQTAASSNRLNYEMRLTLDGVEIPGSRVTSYIRGNANGNGTYTGTLVYSGIIQKTSASDQVLNIEVRRESIGGTAATDIIASETALSMAALPSTGKYISLTSTTSAQSLSTTRTAFNWDEQLAIDTAVYTHSTTTNNTRINFDIDGDYLFFSTAYSSRTAGTVRSSPVIEWQLDGSGTPLAYGGHGSYNRGDQGTNDAFTAGSSGGMILSGVTAGQFLEVTRIDEAANTNPTFPTQRIAVQGVKLAELFITDVEVSATGTNKVDIDIPATNVYAGGGFVIESNNGVQTVNNITITESGTVDGSLGLENIELWYDLDTVAPYDCTGELYGDGEAEIQFGSTDVNGFSGADGTAAFSGSVALSETQSMCVYAVYDVTSSATDGQTVQIFIDNATTDVGMSGSPSIIPSTPISPAGSTFLRNAELTLTNYNWRNDNGSESTATSIEGIENTPAIGFANGTTRRLRLGVSAEGSTSSPATQYRLEYAQKISTCSAASSWIDVGTGGGGDWDIVNTANLTDGADTTNVALQSNGGITDPVGGSFLTPNGGQKTTSSQTGNIILASSQFTELEYAIEPTLSAPQGNTYCFRVSDAGTALRNYTNYAEGTISADIDVSASSSQTATLDVGSTGQYVGGTFVIERPGTNRTITDITLTETGTIDALLNLDNIELWYDLDTVAPYDCTGESYTGVGESQFGVTDTSGFSGNNGSSTFSGSQIINNTQTMCGYVLVDVGSGATDGETINIEISDPSTDVVVTSSSVGPSSVVSPTGNTTVSGPILTQTHYHWRQDDGDETDAGALSATGGIEDTPLLEVAKGSTQRLRLQVSNEGSVGSAATIYRLEYGTKVTTCSAVGTWSQVGVGSAFATSASPFISDGNTTNINNAANGAMTEENVTFVGTGALRETTVESGSITLSSTQYTELEYAIEATDASGYNTDYCFRVTDAGTELPAYNTYAEMTTREKQDFFVQRGTQYVTGTGVTLTAGVDYTAPSATTSAFVRITTSQMTGAGNNTGGGNQNADDVTAYISDQSDITTSFTIGRPSAAVNGTRVDWEIIEYIGLPGADNEFIVRDVGTVAYGLTDLTATGTATFEVVDSDDVVVFITGQTTNETATTNYASGLSTSAWASTSNESVFTRGTTGDVSNVSYAVVEYTGLNWKIQRVEHNYTLAGSTQTQPITAVSSLSTAFVYAQMRTGVVADNGLDDYGQQVFLSSLGAVSYQLNAGSEGPGEHYSVAWVIENMQTGSGAMVVYRDANSVNADEAIEPRTTVFDFNGTVSSLSNASIWITNDSTGGGTAFPRPMLGIRPINTSQFEIFESDAGQTQTFRVAMVQWPVAQLAFEQNYYRFYVDNDLLLPDDPYPVGTSDLGENTSVTGADDPLGEGDRIRMRMTMQINNASLPEATKSFKLQYGRRDTSSCSAISIWNDVGAVASGEIWRGYNATPVDGTEIAGGGSLLISLSDVAGTYEEENNSAVNPNFADIDDDVEFDWLIEHNGATQLSDYCFRMTESDGTLFAGYNNYPTIRTTGYTPVIGNWRWYDDETNATPVLPLALENVMPNNIVNGNELKLRVTASEVEGAPGTNVKFKLQFSESADFSVGVYDVVASSSCTATSTWCYIDAAGVDNAIIDSAVLSDADACVAGVGNGCGTYNEAATTTSSQSQPSLSNMEFEFAVKPAAPRVNAVYYFRLFDVTNDISVSASSSYPSLQIEGASLVFTISGVDSGVTTEGIITDATTTANTILLDSVPFDTEIESAQRLTISTNATEGYQILMYSDQDLTNGYGSTIPPVTGTNAVPTGWTTGSCPTEASGCFGYHAGDDILQGNDPRFGADDSYAAFTTTPQEVMYKSIPASESYDMVYKIQIRQEQPAGEYQANITYIAIPVF